MSKRYYDKHRDKLIIISKNYAMKNPEKPNIVWPDREKTIDKFIKKMYDKLNS